MLSVHFGVSTRTPTATHLLSSFPLGKAIGSHAAAVEAGSSLPAKTNKFAPSPRSGSKPYYLLPKLTPESVVRAQKNLGEVVQSDDSKINPQLLLLMVDAGLSCLDVRSLEGFAATPSRLQDQSSEL